MPKQQEISCNGCGGSGVIIEEMDSKELPDGNVWQSICHICNGSGKIALKFIPN